MTKLIAVISLLLLPATAARAQPGADSTTGTTQIASDPDLRPPSAVPTASTEIPMVAPRSTFGTTEPWGGGMRLTALSGIGALPGVNYGGEIAAQIRHDEMFAELGFGWWKPEKTHMVTSTPQPVELGLDVWTLRAGWASMQTPLRGWVLGEVGEIARAREMPGVVARMVMGDVPQGRGWQAIGAGFGVAWPMSDNARLFGMVELAVPLERQTVMLDQGPYQPDALVARSSAGLEVGWR